ncbi:MAG: SDR family oxidoreductase [Chloroflexi bacterium]|nr:SDR family oxidoreductase [Chloroflexota bacterium]
MSTEPGSATDGLSGQVAIVTGGGRGLGRAFAQALAAAGVKVAITARTETQLNETVRLIEHAGGTAIAFTADVTDRPAMERVANEVEKQFGPVDILVNNAAVITPLGYSWEVDADEWWRALEINVRGPFLCTQVILPGMVVRRRGRVINVTSGAAHGPIPYASAYCTSKAALSHMTNVIAAEVKEYGIKVFALGPSGATAMIETIATSPKVPEEVRSSTRRSLEEPSGWIERTEKSVKLLMLLVSGQADFLTGRHIGWPDSIDELLHHADDIVRDDLYTLRRRVLSQS